MTTQFTQFKKYKLTATKVSERYCEHTIAREKVEKWTRGERLGRGASREAWVQHKGKGMLRAVK